MKIDPKLQQRWEKILRDRGLGVDQPMTDNSEGSMELESFSGTSNVGKKLRAKIDGNDPFMDRGYGIKTVRSLEREIPEWALSDRAVQRVLLTSFPKMLRDPNQRRRAKVWVSAIYLYYRMALPRQIVAREMGVSKETLNRIIQKIDFVSKGLTATGIPRKKKGVSSPAPFVRESGEKGNDQIESAHLPVSGNGGNEQDGAEPVQKMPMQKRG